MKKKYANSNHYWLGLILLLGVTTTHAQAPEKMSYQALIRDANGDIVADALVGMRISILQGTITGTAAYVETQSLFTDENGMASLMIGAGTPVTNTFSAIDWPNGPFFLKTETDPAGGASYSITGTSQLLSVPYALYADGVPGPQGAVGDQGPQGTAGTDGVDTRPTYTVGQFAQGGIVFWVDETGKSGLVCTKTDQSTGVRWYAGTYGNTQAKGDGPGAGELNTRIIIAAQVPIGDDGATYAA
ncbi:MAG: hypothetical protein O2887_17055 [Bacteroidetes bacterium]|nr:hypothetical protein [Bacteroidota bacterium]MDA1122170.1 hypothetical protein [Bacteroidota bacterium]